MKHTAGNNLNDNIILEEIVEHPKLTQTVLIKCSRSTVQWETVNNAHGSPYYVDVIIRVRNVNHRHDATTTQHILDPT